MCEELKKLSRYSEPSSLLLADIDFFKKINDTYGHPSGDLVLKEELIEKADQALYYAKHNGRNRSVLWSEIKN